MASDSTHPENHPSGDVVTAASIGPAAGSQRAASEFIDAELVPDAPSPWVFGMRGLFILTGVAGVQFALMSYLGVLIGLLVGIAVCVVAIAGLIVVPVVAGLRPGTSSMDRLDQIAIRLTFGIILLFIGSMLAGGGQILYTVFEGWRVSWRVQQDLGFTYEASEMWNRRYNAVNILRVKTVEPGGPFDQAGIQQGDVIVLEQTPDDFLRMLSEQSGNAVDMNVASDVLEATSTPVDQWPARAVTVAVP